MAEIRFYNTLAHREQPFVPIEPNRVSMYHCGPTVYDYAHIGNFRAFLLADVLRRFFEMSGYEVDQVMNITDVGHMTQDNLADGGGEDKMVAAGRRLKEAKKAGLAPIDNPDDPYQVAAYYTQAFIDDARALGMKLADDPAEKMPRATDHIDAMQRMIGKLIDTGHAYVTAGAVYFDVQSFADYGKLSGNTLEQLRGGAGGRVLEEHQADKKHPGDFLLWKRDDSHIMKWDSPWGSGYPGWHIECSAMATTLLGRDTLDIHTGGEDNIFPHHECEIAQTCCATGQPQFANTWLHTRFLRVEGEKMSKSKGNFFTVRDVLEGKVTGRTVDPAVLRYELIKSHYRKNADFTRKGLEDSASAIKRLRTAAGTDEVEPAANDHPAVVAFMEQLSNDLNMAGALAVVFEQVQKKSADLPAVLRRVDQVLGVLSSAELAQTAGDETLWCQQLDEARANKDYATADRLRQQLIDAGFEVKTTAQGSVATRPLA